MARAQEWPEAPIRDAAPGEPISLMRVHLPCRDRLTPYLDAIDHSGWYSNNGPLVRQFEERLSVLCTGQPGQVATTANGTTALTLALMAQEPTRGGLCLVPSFTFAATIHSIVQAGLRPFFLDVSPQTWALDEAHVRDVADQHEDIVACVPVVPFGAPMDPTRWARLARDKNLAVVIDGAAAIGSLQETEVPVAVSLHATKPLGTGEGGFVLWRDPAGLQTIRQLANFGFTEDRASVFHGLNGKMSEYHAAVGLASLEGFAEKRRTMMETARGYRSRLAHIPFVRFQRGWGEAWCASTLSVRTPLPASVLGARLRDTHNIETRQWWAHPCHTMAPWVDAPQEHMPVTLGLSREVIGLPFHGDLSAQDLDRIVGAIQEARHALSGSPAATQ